MDLALAALPYLKPSREHEAALFFMTKMSALVPLQDSLKANATVGSLIDYFRSAIASLKDAPYAG